jgi:hypothetical protein
VSDLGTVWDLLSHTGFLTAFTAGFGVLLALYLTSVMRKGRLAGWALGLSLVVTWVLTAQFGIDPATVLALAAVAIAGLILDVARTVRRRPWRLAGQTLAGALLFSSVVSFTGSIYEPGAEWPSVAVPAVAITMGLALYMFGRGSVGSFLGPMLAVSILGIWVTVPETDMVTVLMGASLTLAPATVTPIKASTSVGGAFAVACLVTWLTVAGGQTVPVTIAGGWAAIGLIPLVSAIVAFDRYLPSRRLVFVFHVVYVVIITRVVDLSPSIALALMTVVILNILAAALLLGLTARRDMPDDLNHSVT